MNIELKLGEKQQNAFGEAFYTGVNQYLFTNQSSETVYKANFAELFSEDEMLFIVAGTDSGLFYDYVKSQKLPSTLRFIFMDFENVIEALGLTPAVEADDFKQQVVVVKNDFDFELINQYYESYAIRKRLYLIKSMAVIDAEPGSAYFQFWDALDARYQEFYKGIAVAQSAFHFENAGLLNTADNIQPLIKFEGALKETTAILLGGGPTLDDVIDWVKENQDSLVIFSAARIARRLAKEGIQPDFFVSVDPHDISFDNSKGIFAFEDHSVLLNSYHINPKLLGQWKGLTSFSGDKYRWKNDDHIKNINSPGPNVINSALGIAVHLGCQNVILSGVDFCFAKGRTHESSSDEAKASSQLSYQTAIRVEANSGEMTPSEILLVGGRETMENQVQLYLKTEPSLRFYSTGFGSAKMKNVQYLPAEKIDFLGSKTKDKIDELKQNMVISQSYRLESAQSALDELKKKIKQFKEMHKLSVEALKVMPKLFDKFSNEPKFKPMNKVQKLRRRVNRLVGEDGDMLLSYRGDNFADTYKPVEDEKALTPEEITQQLTGFFQGVKASSTEYQHSIDLAIERTELRIDELEGKVALTELYKAWEKIDQFGRARLWREWHSDKVLTEEEREILQKAEDLFTQEVERTDTEQLKRLKESTQNVQTLLDRAARALDLKDAKELNVLLEHAPQLEKPEYQEEFAKLIQGMLFELQNDQVNAESLYRAISLPDLKHIALKRLLTFTMDARRHEESMVLLEQLCHFSLDYMVPYSDLMALLGQDAMAIEILQMYLAQHPDKVSVQIKLAQRHLELSQGQEAIQVLEKVLELDPDNKTAKHILGR